MAWEYRSSSCISPGDLTREACQRTNDADEDHAWVFHTCEDIDVRALWLPLACYARLRVLVYWQLDECGACPSPAECGTYRAQLYLHCFVEASDECSGRDGGEGCGGSCDDRFLANSGVQAGSCILPWTPNRPGTPSFACPKGSVGTTLGCVDRSIHNKVGATQRSLLACYALTWLSCCRLRASHLESGCALLPRVRSARAEGWVA